MRLAYRTRANSSPQGKSRVYYTGHPDDYALYLDEITADIHRTQNCAIYYDAEPETAYDPENLRHEISQMQIMVIPITGRFLQEANRARDVEMVIARELHIPVLPILMEQEIISLFNDQCGDLQFLDRNTEDSSAMSYEERLERTLNDILIADDLAQRVRAAFRAYIFLSYRKKDRRLAQDLMRRIHRRETCRDIAIWYDEFLRVGENWSDEIAAAVRKCDLFAMNVTPRIVEPGNYIMTTEYPAAASSGKVVLPIETAPTDPQMLAENYPGLPSCINAHDDAALQKSLREHLGLLQDGLQEREPEHDYLMGLAYLNGIDVEVDRERGVALIQSAAHRGDQEAMRRLAIMYDEANGVARDYDESIRWQRRLIESYRNDYRAHDDEESGLGLCVALAFYGSCLQNLARYEEAESAYQEEITTAQEMIDRHHSLRATLRLFIGYTGLGELYSLMGDSGRAQASLTEGITKCERLCSPDVPGDPYQLELMEVLGESYATLVDLLIREGHLTQARAWLNKAIVLDQELADRDERQYGGILSRDYLRMCDISREEGRLEDAYEWCDKALRIRQERAAENPTVGNRRRLAIAHREWSLIYSDPSREDERLEHRRTALRLYEEIAAETGAMSDRRLLATLCGEMGNYYKDNREQFQEAEPWLQRSLEIHEALYEEMHDIADCRSCAVAYERMAGLQRGLRHYKEAERLCDLAIRMMRDVRRESDSVFHQRLYIDLSMQMAGLCDDINSFEKAEYWYLQAWEMCQCLYEQESTFDLQRQRLECAEQLGSLHRRMGRTDQARSILLEAYRIARRMCDELQIYGAEIHICTVCTSLYEIYCDLGDSHKADLYLDEAARRIRSLAERERGEIVARQNAAVILGLQGTRRIENSQMDEAYACCEEAMRFVRSALGDVPASQSLIYTMASLQELMGQWYYANGENAPAQEHYEAAAQTYLDLWNANHMDQDLGQLAIVYYNLAQTLSEDPRRQRRIVRQALDYMEYLVDLYPEIPDYQEVLNIIHQYATQLGIVDSVDDGGDDCNCHSSEDPGDDHGNDGKDGAL